jgi:ribosomal protein S18 acetylase RimI-like enzyme
MNTSEKLLDKERGGEVRIRPAEAADLAQVIALDERITRVAKAGYWHDLHARYQTRGSGEGFFFVAERAQTEGRQILGFVIGEVRAWEFGSAPCGWVFALSVHPDARQSGVGERLLVAISDAFKGAGVDTMRTMILRDNHLLMSFFRSEGLMAGPYIQLEKELT